MHGGRRLPPTHIMSHSPTHPQLAPEDGPNAFTRQDLHTHRPQSNTVLYSNILPQKYWPKGSTCRCVPGHDFNPLNTLEITYLYWTTGNAHAHAHAHANIATTSPLAYASHLSTLISLSSACARAASPHRSSPPPPASCSKSDRRARQAGRSATCSTADRRADAFDTCADGANRGGCGRVGHGDWARGWGAGRGRMELRAGNRGVLLWPVSPVMRDCNGTHRPALHAMRAARGRCAACQRPFHNT